MKRPPIERVYYTAAIGQMAVARATGSITWAEAWPDGEGILLWEDLASASDWQISLAGRPVAVVEIPRADIRPGLLQPVVSPELRALTRDRLWIYPEPIHFTHVRWHTYREDMIEPARHYEVVMPTVPPAIQDLPSGTITLTV